MAAGNDSLSARAAARLGQTLRNKWRIERLIGVGGMAAVYAATHRNGKRGAIKMLHLELSTNREVTSRFLREGYVANKVDHPGAVSVMDDDMAEDGSVFIVMELLEGLTLDALARGFPGGRLPIAETLGATVQLLDVLAAAHEKSIVHRDLKPENVFVTREGKVKVLDFGIARLREISVGSADATRAGLALGTPSFMPPEQALGKLEVDHRSDLWAVGATMFAVLTGRKVHVADNLNQLLLAAMTQAAPKIGSVDSTVPSPVAQIVDQALEFQQANRFQDARSMQQAVLLARQQLGIPNDDGSLSLAALVGQGLQACGVPGAPAPVFQAGPQPAAGQSFPGATPPTPYPGNPSRPNLRTALLASQPSAMGGSFSSPSNAIGMPPAGGSFSSPSNAIGMPPAGGSFSSPSNAIGMPPVAARAESPLQMQTGSGPQLGPQLVDGSLGVRSHVSDGSLGASSKTGASSPQRKGIPLPLVLVVVGVLGAAGIGIGVMRGAGLRGPRGTATTATASAEAGLNSSAAVVSLPSTAATGNVGTPTSSALGAAAAPSASSPSTPAATQVSPIPSASAVTTGRAADRPRQRHSPPSTEAPVTQKKDVLHEW